MHPLEISGEIISLFLPSIRCGYAWFFPDHAIRFQFLKTKLIPDLKKMKKQISGTARANLIAALDHYEYAVGLIVREGDFSVEEIDYNKVKEMTNKERLKEQTFVHQLNFAYNSSLIAFEETLNLKDHERLLALDTAFACLLLLYADETLLLTDKFHELLDKLHNDPRLTSHIVGFQRRYHLSNRIIGTIKKFKGYSQKTIDNFQDLVSHLLKVTKELIATDENSAAENLLEAILKPKEHRTEYHNFMKEIPNIECEINPAGIKNDRSFQSLYTILKERYTNIQLYPLSEEYIFEMVTDYVPIKLSRIANPKLSRTQLQDASSPNAPQNCEFSQVNQSVDDVLASFDEHDCKGIVTIEGESASGKTVFAEYIGFLWSADKLKKRYDLVFVEKLRNTVKSATVFDLVTRRYMEKYQMNIKDLLISEKAKDTLKILVILDGLDEVHEEHVEQLKSYKQDEIKLPFDVLITSKPSAIKVWKLFGPHFKLQLFDERQKQEFVQKFYKASVQEQLGERLKRQVAPEIWRMGDNPLLLFLICVIYKSNLFKYNIDIQNQNESKQLPNNIWEVYHVLFRLLIDRCEQKNVGNPSPRPLIARLNNTDEMHPLKKWEKTGKVQALGKMALDKLLCKPQILFFDENDLRRYKIDGSLFIEIGLLDKQTPIHARPIDNAGYYQFRHKTFQEFFAFVFLFERLLHVEVRIAGETVMEHADVASLETNHLPDWHHIKKVQKIDKIPEYLEAVFNEVHNEVGNIPKLLLKEMAQNLSEIRKEPIAHYDSGQLCNYLLRLHEATNNSAFKRFGSVRTSRIGSTIANPRLIYTSNLKNREEHFNQFLKRVFAAQGSVKSSSDETDIWMFQSKDSNDSVLIMIGKGISSEAIKQKIKNEQPRMQRRKIEQVCIWINMSANLPEHCFTTLGLKMLLAHKALNDNVKFHIRCDIHHANEIDEQEFFRLIGPDGDAAIREQRDIDRLHVTIPRCDNSVAASQNIKFLIGKLLSTFGDQTRRFELCSEVVQYISGIMPFVGAHLRESKLIKELRFLKLEFKDEKDVRINKSDLPPLQTIGLQQCSIDTELLLTFASSISTELREIRKIVISNMPNFMQYDALKEFLKILARLPKLECLYLIDRVLECENDEQIEILASSLPHFHSLKTLKVSNNDLRQSDYDILAKATNIPRIIGNIVEEKAC